MLGRRSQAADPRPTMPCAVETDECLARRRSNVGSRSSKKACRILGFALAAYKHDRRGRRVLLAPDAAIVPVLVFTGHEFSIVKPASMSAMPSVSQASALLCVNMTVITPLSRENSIGIPRRWQSSSLRSRPRRVPSSAYPHPRSAPCSRPPRSSCRSGRPGRSSGQTRPSVRFSQT